MRNVILAAAVALGACQEAPAPAIPPPEPSAPATDRWIGLWPGVEGTFLRIEAGNAAGTYQIIQGTLDGERRSRARRPAMSSLSPRPMARR